MVRKDMQRRQSTRLSNSVVSTIVVGIILTIIIFQTPSAQAFDEIPSGLNTGPFVDGLVYRVIANQDQRLQELQAGTIVMDTSFYDPYNFNILNSDPDIDTFAALRNGYGHITINCRDYPLNITGLRRAFAYAFDKTRVTSEIFNGFSIEHDSLVPQASSWCVEDDFDWHYYSNQSDIGNQILDSLDFEINETTGYRNAPNGQPFDIVIDYSCSSEEIAGGCAQIGVDALHSLHIKASRDCPNEYPNPIDNHLNYDMIFYAATFYSNDVDWLADEYWSENAVVFGKNPSNFVNATFDSWRDQLLHGTTYEEVYEASAEMQKILQYSVPRLVVYENTYMQAYRNDTYTGFVEDLGRYISGSWTMRKIHPIDSQYGGTVPIAISSNPDSFNIYVTHSANSAAMLTNLYSSLYRYGPDLNPCPDLATNLIIETHDDNAAVPAGHTRFTIDIVHNATWSDGIPLTSLDIVGTFTYQLESAVYENPAASDLAELVGAYAPNPYRVVFEFSSESYWHFSKFAFDYIIPYHIFNQLDGIKYDEWESWNPVFNSGDPMVTSGPFTLTDFRNGEWYELTRNTNFYYEPSDAPIPSFQTKPTIEPIENITYIEGSTGNFIYWRVQQGIYDPGIYRIELNGTLVLQAAWYSKEIAYNIDNLSVGTYEFTLTLYDVSNNKAQGNVFVTVLPSTAVTSTTTTTSSSNMPNPQLTPIQFGFIAVLISSCSIIIIVYSTTAIAKKRRESDVMVSSEPAGFETT